MFALVQPKLFDLSKPLVSKGRKGAGGRGAGENYVNKVPGTETSIEEASSHAKIAERRKADESLKT
jgi:hypothetical protein